MSPGRKTSGAVARYEQEAVRRPRPDSGDLGQRRLDLVVGHAREGFVAQSSLDEALGERTERRALSQRDRSLEAPADSWPAAPRPTGDVLSAPRDARGWCVARTESCWPAIWKISVPNESSGGSSFVQARGRKSGRSSISLARTGSARRRNARARGSATALTTAVRLPPARARRAGRRARTSRRGGRRRYRRSASR